MKNCEFISAARPSSMSTRVPSRVQPVFSPWLAARYSSHGWSYASPVAVGKST